MSVTKLINHGVIILTNTQLITLLKAHTNDCRTICSTEIVVVQILLFTVTVKIKKSVTNEEVPETLIQYCCDL